MTDTTRGWPFLAGNDPVPLTPEALGDLCDKVQHLRLDLWMGSEGLPLMAEQYVALARNELDNATRFLTLAKYSVMRDK